jgi:hypothetical protein
MCGVAYREFMSSGTALFSVFSMSALGAQEGVEHREVEHIIDALIDEGLIETAGGRTLTAGPEMALYYELEIDLRAHVKANVLRCELLRAGVDAYLDSTEVTTITRDDRGPFEQYEWGELYAATEVLEKLPHGVVLPPCGYG